MLRKQREEPLEEVPDAPDDAPVPDDAAVSTDNIQYLTELIGQMKPMYRDPLRLLAMGYTNREIAESLGLTDEVANCTGCYRPVPQVPAAEHRDPAALGGRNPGAKKEPTGKYPAAGRDGGDL